MILLRRLTICVGVGVSFCVCLLTIAVFSPWIPYDMIVIGNIAIAPAAIMGELLEGLLGPIRRSLHQSPSGRIIDLYLSGIASWIIAGILVGLTWHLISNLRKRLLERYMALVILVLELEQFAGSSRVGELR